MKKLVLLFVFVALFLCGLNAQGRRGLIKHWRPPSSNGPGFSFRSLFGYGTLSGGIPGTMYLSMAFGPSFLGGDMAGTSSTTPSFGKNNMVSLGLTHIFPGNFGYKLSYMYGLYDGSDIGSKLYYRNYSYSTKLSEISLLGEYFIFGGPYSPNSSLHSLYAFGGVGVIISNSLSTGDQPSNKIYNPKSTTPDIPFGLGYKYAVTDNFLIGAEFGEHYAFGKNGDYVDGLNPISGNKSKDILTHFAMTLTFRFYKDNKY